MRRRKNNPTEVYGVLATLTCFAEIQKKSFDKL